MTERDAEPLFETEIESVDVDVTPVTERVDDAAGLEVNIDAARHDSEYTTVPCVGSLVESTSVSVNGIDPDEPRGGVQEIEIVAAAGAVSLRLEIGRPATENQEPEARDPVSEALKSAAPLLVIEMLFVIDRATPENETVELGAGVDEKLDAGVQVSV